MKNLIYYPSFEVSDENWLKYALLFFKDLQMIVPQEGDNSLSDTFKLLEEKQFCKKIRSIDYNVKDHASSKAIEAVKQILSTPEKYFHLFKTTNIRERWQNKSNWTSELYGQKFHWDWKEFLKGEKNKFGVETDNGVLLNEELSHLYMSILTHVLSDIREEPCITDRPKLDEAAISIRREYYQNNKEIVEEQLIFKKLLKTKGPKNINNIPLDKIIEFRFSDKNNELQSIFLESVENYLSSVEGKGNVQDYEKSLEVSHKEYANAMIDSGFELGEFALVVWLTLQDGNLEWYEWLANYFMGRKTFIGQKTKINKTWKDIQNSKKTRQYLSNMNKI